VIEHNRLELAETGEQHFVRDFGLLESALARPRNSFAYGEEDLVVLAVTLMAGISRAHAFEQGNKRTAFYDTAFDDSVPWADEMISLIEHRSTEEDFTRAVRPYVVPRS